MMSTVLAVIAVIAWSATAAVAVADLVGNGTRTDKVARAGVGLAAAFTLAAGVAAMAEFGMEGLVGRSHRFGFLAGVVSLGALTMTRRGAMRAMTALSAPFASGLLAAHLFSAHGAADGPMEPLLVVHVGVVLIGIGAFALAAFLSVLYLMQERQLRQRKFGSLFQRLPSLQELDAAAFRLVLWGFVAYTVALIVGFVWMAQSAANPGFGRAGLAVMAWAVFAAVIHTRVTTGWRGRQSALMTILGCITTYAVLAGYMLR